MELVQEILLVQTKLSKEMKIAFVILPRLGRHSRMPKNAFDLKMIKGPNIHIERLLILFNLLALKSDLGERDQVTQFCLHISFC